MRKGVAIAGRQLEIAKKGLLNLDKSKPQHYNEVDIWQELENASVLQ